MKVFRNITKNLLRIGTGFFLLVAVYFIVAGICCCIPVNTDTRDEKDVLIAVISNGVHTDIAVPAKNEAADWTQLLPYSDAKEADSTYHYVSFGWGDKGFYIETPTWAELKASTAVKAMFWMSTSAMHVTWKKELPPKGIRCRKFRISKTHYAALCEYIRGTFEPKGDQRVQFIPAPTYGKHDAFYEAEGTYSMLTTCNVWTGNGLKKAGIRVAVWTPFEKSIFQQLPASEE